MVQRSQTQQLEGPLIKNLDTEERMKGLTANRMEEELLTLEREELTGVIVMPGPDASIY